MLETLKHMLLISALYSIPMYATFTISSFIFWGHPWKIYLGRIALFVILCSFCSFYFQSIWPTPYFFIHSMAAYFVLFLAIFRHLSLAERLKLAMSSWVLGFMAEALFDLLSNSYPSLGFDRNQPLPLAPIAWSTFLLFALLSFLMARSPTRPGPAILKYFHGQGKQRMSYLILFLLIQVVLIFLLQLMILHQIGIPDRSLLTVLYAATLPGFAIILVAMQWTSQTKLDAIRMTQQVYHDDYHRMLTVIRGQRHDFLNHVQVIQSFVKMEKYKELEIYTRELVGEVAVTNQMLHIGDPFLSALLQIKSITAEQSQIILKQHFTDLDHLKLDLKSVDMVKIVGNLLDNAFDEVIQLPPELRWVELKGWTEQDMLIFTVRNPGRVISHREIDKIFSLGYSTKNRPNHSGVGLSVVKERVEYYKGNVQVKSCPEEGTVFQVKIPLNLNWTPLYP